MMYPFRVVGRTIEVCRYRVDYTVELPPEKEGGEAQTEALSRLYRTQEAAEKFSGRVNGMVVENDTTNYDWLEGLQIPDDAMCPMDAAVGMAEMGQATYEARLTSAAATNPVQLRADVDYLAIMTGVTL